MPCYSFSIKLYSQVPFFNVRFLKQPQATYTAFTKGFRSKFTYFMRTIENFEKFVTPIDDLLHDTFIHTLLGINNPLDKSYRKIISQPTRNGGLGIPNLVKAANSQHQSSKLLSRIHVQSIIEQRMIMGATDCEGNTQNDLRKMDTAIKLNLNKNITK